MNSPMHAARDPAQVEPYLINRPERQTIPLVFASPHSGQQYPDQLLLDARMDPLSLRRSEDSFVDELFGAAPSLGAPLIAASFPRVWCDVNREAWELDPAMFTEPLPPWVNSAAALAGLIAAGDIRGADANNAGLWLELDAILAVVIGGTSLMGGRFSIPMSVLGAIIIQAMNTGILISGFSPEFNLVVTSAVIIVILVLQSPLSARIFRRRSLPGSPK